MTVMLGEPIPTDPQEVEADAATEQVLALWGMVLAGALAYRDFIGIAAEVITAANLTSWEVADLTVVTAALAGTDIEALPIGYGAPWWVNDPRRVERELALMLNKAISAEVEVLREQGRVDEAMAAQDDLRARKLVRFVDNETNRAYSSSEGVAVLTLGKHGLVDGWVRRLAAPKVYPARSAAWGKARGRSRGGSSSSPCTWCITLNGNNAVRPWYYRMGRHAPVDHCRKDPVQVPLEQIGGLWRNAFERSSLGFRSAGRFVDEGEFGLEFFDDVAA